MGAFPEPERAESPIGFNRGERHNDGHDDDADLGVRRGWNDVDSGNAGAEVAKENAAKDEEDAILT